MTVIVWDSVLPTKQGEAKRVQLGSCVLELTVVSDHVWTITERIGATSINHGRLVFHGRHYTAAVPGGAPIAAARWEQTLRLHLGIR